MKSILISLLVTSLLMASNNTEKKKFMEENTTKQEVTENKKEIPVNNSLLPDLPSQEKVSSIVKKDNNKDYEMVLKLLQTKQTVVNNASSSIDNFKLNEDTEKNNLPTPFKATKIGEQIIVFAKYRENEVGIIKNNEKPIQQLKDTNNLNNLGSNINSGNPISKETTNLTKNNNSSTSVSFNTEKEIKLKLNMDFGDWHVWKLDIHEVIFRNKKTNEEIKKYF